MEKQLKLFINKTLVLFLLFSCNNASTKNNIDQSKTVSQKIIQPILDTELNALKLRDTTSILNQFGDLTKFVVQNYNKGQCVKLTNKSESQSVFLRAESGGYKNQYDHFFIENNIVKPAEIAKKTSYDFFSSNKGAFIGMDKNIFLEKYNDLKFTAVESNDSITYTYNDSINAYRARYTFHKNILIGFDFGYQD